MKIKGAIFDLDGTLINSMQEWEALPDRFLRSLGVEPTVDLRKVVRPMSLPDAMNCYKQTYNLPQTCQELMDGVNNMIDDVYATRVPPTPGALAILQHLHSCGIPICIATASIQRHAKFALTRLGMLPYIKKIFTCEMVGQGKDSPAVFLAAQQHMGTPIAQTVVFEDALHAIQTAVGAGFPVYAVYDVAEDDNTPAIRALAQKYGQDLAHLLPQL